MKIDIGLAASVDTRQSTTSEVGLVFIIPLIDHLNRFICDKYLVFSSKMLPKHRHVYIQSRPTEERFRFVVLRGLLHWYSYARAEEL